MFFKTKTEGFYSVQSSVEYFAILTVILKTKQGGQRFPPALTGTRREAMTARSPRNSTSLCYWISVLLLLLILVQMLTSLVVFGGEFICSREAAISPFHFCLIQHGEKSCDVWKQPDSDIKWDTFRTVIILSLYAPLVLVAFALLSTLLAAYSGSRDLLWLSAALQTASSLLILTGVITFVTLNHSYLSWENLTTWFYICCGVHFELGFAAALTCVSADKMRPAQV